MKRILINATHNEEIRVALCKDNHLYDFDLENRTREQKKANIYKGHITRIEPSLEAVFVEYGSSRQGFLPLREIAPEYLDGNRDDNIKKILKEGDELIIQVEKEERGNKGAAISTYISLAGRYLVLMPNNAKGGGISRQISGKVRDDMRSIIARLDVPKGMSVIVRTAGIGKTYEDLQQDLTNLLQIWAGILNKAQTEPSPCLLYQEAGVVTRAVRDYLRDDIGEVWIDSEHAYNEAASFIASVMPNQMSKLRKYTDYEPLFVRFGIERQIESAYQREVRLPSGGSIVIDQTEALVSIDINSAKSTKGSDVAETAYHTNLEAADEIARQLRLRDMGGLIVIDFIDMNDPRHQKEVEKRLIDATRYDRARVQFAEISRFGLMEMSRQRLRPSLEESTGYICPRCHGNGMIRDVRSLALSIMRQIEQLALKHRSGEIQAEVPTEIAAFLLNEKRESLVYLEQDSGTRITILPHAHLESPNFTLHFNPDGFAPASYDRIVDAEEQQNIDRGYDVDWQTKQPNTPTKGTNHWQQGYDNKPKANQADKPKAPAEQTAPTQAVAWLSNLFAPKPQASLAHSLQSSDAAAAIEAIVNTGASSLGALGTLPQVASAKVAKPSDKTPEKSERTYDKAYDKDQKERQKAKAVPEKAKTVAKKPSDNKVEKEKTDKDKQDKYPKREAGSHREPRMSIERSEPLSPSLSSSQNLATQGIAPKETPKEPTAKEASKDVSKDASKDNKDLRQDKPVTKLDNTEPSAEIVKDSKVSKPKKDKGELSVRIERTHDEDKAVQTVHLSLDNSKPRPAQAIDKPASSDSIANEQIINEQADKQGNEQESEQAVNKPIAQADDKAEKPTDQISQEPTQKPEQEPSADALVSTPTQTTTAQETAIQEAITQETITQDVAQEVAPVVAQDTAVQEVVAPPVATVSSDSTDSKAILVNVKPETITGTLPTTPKLCVDTAKIDSIAKLTSRVKNDPRVVMQALGGSTITGSAGEFIRRRLADADARLAHDGFVACFIDALNQPSQAFSFANYGYDTLKDDYLEKFGLATQSKGQFGTHQGKTDAPERPRQPRAKNDPRGEYVEPITPVVSSQPVEPNVEPMAEPVLVPTEEPSKQAIKPKATKAKDGEPKSDVKPEQNKPTGDKKTPDELADKVLEELGKVMDELIQSLGKPDEPKLAVEEKTTQASYKNMIENIAEQLLPQTGILNLAKPKKATKKAVKKTTKVAIKIPKTDSKPKTEVRKRKVKTDDVETTSQSDTPNAPNDQ